MRQPGHLAVRDQLAEPQRRTAEPTVSEPNFSQSELNRYGAIRIEALTEVLLRDNDVELAVVCDRISTEIGRDIFEGSPREFITAFVHQFRELCGADR